MHCLHWYQFMQHHSSYYMHCLQTQFKRKMWKSQSSSQRLQKWWLSSPAPAPIKPWDLIAILLPCSPPSFARRIWQWLLTSTPTPLTTNPRCPSKQLSSLPLPLGQHPHSCNAASVISAALLCFQQPGVISSSSSYQTAPPLPDSQLLLCSRQTVYSKLCWEDAFTLHVRCRHPGVLLPVFDLHKHMHLCNQSCSSSRLTLVHPTCHMAISWKQ